MELNIRGVILQKYPSASAFARSMGWPRQKASDIMNGRRKPSADEMTMIANDVGLTNAESFMAVFFPNMSTK